MNDMLLKFRPKIILTGIVFLACLQVNAAKNQVNTKNSSGDKKPNIIFILTDDQRWDALGYAGNKIIQTPEMDKLAEIMAGPKAMDIGSLCKTYAKIRPGLLRILPIFANIPVLGRIVPPVRLLMLIGDSFCQIS